MRTGPKGNTPDTLKSRLDIDPITQCWIYNGLKDRDGYGRMTYEAKQQFAHRLAYAFWVAPLIPGLVVMHKCDNRPCCNPGHLKQDTQGVNNRDCSAKGRKPKGSANGNAKLTEYQVSKMREWFLAGTSKEELSKIFNVSRLQIRKIIRFEAWAS